MTPAEKLKRIRARCAELLAIAEKRTPGKWLCPNTRTEVFMTDHRPVAMCWGPDATAHGNAAFIAACAGPAEAGWSSTIAAIDDCLNVNPNQSPDGQRITREMMMDVNAAMIGRIIAAWPDELL